MKVLYTLILVFGLMLGWTVEAQQSRRPVTRQSQLQEQQQQAAKQQESDASKAAAQRTRVIYQKNYMKQQGDSLVIDMDIDMTNLNVANNFAQILTPVIASETEEIELPKVYVQGEAKNKAFIRELELNDQVYREFESNLPYAIVKPHGKLNYHIGIPYEPWMAEAALDVEEDLCGCGDAKKIARSRIFDGQTKDVIPQPVYRMQPQLAYIQPEVEKVKTRVEIENAFLDFPRGKNEILPDFGQNAIELAKINKMIKTVGANEDITVQSVSMTGYASPESSEPFNNELSQARAESLMKYFAKNSSIPKSLFETRTGGEDWDGLKLLLDDYPLSNKVEILKLINSIADFDKREKAISKVGGGRPYKIMYEELYPKLRRVVCQVDYTVKDFSIEEAKENLEDAPQLLSLNEMYLVANTYEVGSREFVRVFEIARAEFPDDPVANLNGAAVALENGNLKDGLKYLQLADTSTPEYANNMGVYQMLKGDYREAEKFLKRAESEGLNAATVNIAELRKKLANINSRREAGVDENAGETPASSTPATRRRTQ
jgi:outer membrane protein OmpA-like peptidoglycan-associated protein/predicted negative regulator of RcsB-dependent stress response